MGLFSPNEFLALDLGTHTVKVMHLSAKKGLWKVENFYQLQTGINAQTPQEQIMPRQAAALASLLKESGLRKKPCVGAIPGRHVFFRPLRIPSVGGERLDKIVQYEARQQIPFPLEQVIYDFHQFAGGEVDVDVTLVAAKRDYIEEYVGLVRRSGLNLEHLDVTSVALFNSFIAGHPSMLDDVVALVDIGASTTDIVICSDQTLRFMRSAPVAGNHLTQAIANQSSLPLDEAEQLKCRTFADRQNESLQLHQVQPGQNRVVDAVQQGMEDIVNEVRRSLDFFVSRPEGMPVNTLILSGGTSRIPGVCEYFEERLGLDVINEPGFVADGLDALGLEETDNTVAGVSIGLGLKVAGRAPVDMDFTPPSIRRVKQRRQSTPVFVVEGVLVAMIIGLLAFFVQDKLEFNRQLLGNMRKIVNTTAGIGRPLAEAITTEQDLKQRLELLGDIASRRGFLTTVWGEISRLQPEGVWIESATMSVGVSSVKPPIPGSLGLQGQATQDRFVRDFIANLGVSPYFKNARILDLRASRGGLRYNVYVGELVHPDPAVLEFINLIRKNLEQNAPKEGRRRVEVRTAFVEKNRAVVVYTHDEPDPAEVQSLYRAAVTAVVESNVLGAGSQGKLQIVALGIRGTILSAKQVDYLAAQQLYKAEITYDEFMGEVTPMSTDQVLKNSGGS